MLRGELDPIDWVDAVDPDCAVQCVVIIGEVANDDGRVGDLDVANPDWRQPSPGS